jgi:hypothetical protein
MRALGIVLLVAGCYEPSLPAAPFTCSDGVCPDGYRCEEGLCLAPSVPTPPLLITTTSTQSAPPQPVFDGTQFGVFWNQGTDAPSTDTPPGIYFTTVAADGSLKVTPIYTSPNPLTFTAIYHTLAQRHVVALAQNNFDVSQLLVFTLAPTAGASAQPARMDPRPASALGFSAPSLALSGGQSVALAYTFASPPAVDSNNVECVHLNLVTGDHPGNCTPSPMTLNGSFAVEATVAETQSQTVVFWRAKGVEESLFTGMPLVEQQVIDVPNLARVLRAVYSGTTLAVVGQLPSGSQGAHWVSGPARFAMGGADHRSVDSPDLAPDLVAVDQGFLYCARQEGGDQDGEIAIEPITTSFQSAGPVTFVPRVSRADIVNCRLVVGATTVGVVWQELVPPASLRTYLAQIPKP